MSPITHTARNERSSNSPTPTLTLIFLHFTGLIAFFHVFPGLLRILISMGFLLRVSSFTILHLLIYSIFILISFPLGAIDV